MRHNSKVTGQILSTITATRLGYAVLSKRVSAVPYATELTKT